ncbi:uncharacterized protein LOC119113369 [Pollicipes pollicipes]|uniref:uncharacterized protein LOC119113369 n=1 Tax=Pollicipes pollicipes TaxID=41117 RepID=UPI00188525E3|nr:uncharacterized protein LOC119113369 [Pollicipes pollicipes]
MGGLFMVASSSQMTGDQPCVWVPVYAVPASLCLLVAIKLQYAGTLPWRACYVVHLACCLALLVLVLVRAVRLLHQPAARTTSPAPLTDNEDLVRNARELTALAITIVWMKMTKHVSDSHVRVTLSQQQTTRMLPLLLLLTLAVPGLLWVACQMRPTSGDPTSAGRL